jgi:GH35 family endo-1,4-beta-xylanase
MNSIKLISFLFFGLTSVLTHAQDEYHQDLVNQLSSTFGLEDPVYVLFNTEAAINETAYIYGDASREFQISEDLGFTFADVVVRSAGANPWDAGIGINNQTAIAAGDVVLVHFWMKRSSDTGSVNIFMENGETFEKEFFNQLSITSDWTEYFVPFKSVNAYPIGAMTLGFHIANEEQAIQIGGYTALNFGNIDISTVPNSFSPANYIGYESDAAWRSEAADRIEELRKVNLDILVKDAAGNPLKDVEVKVEMLKHDFGFGSAFAMSRFPNNRTFNQTYLDKITNLDGNGHGFNVGVSENALKWDGWEEEWIGTPEETISAFQWLDDNDIEMRGHVLVWPGFGNLPNDIEQNQNSIAYIKDRISSRLTSMLTNTVLGDLVNDWDILNEITTNRDLESVFSQDPAYESGRELYSEILTEAKALAPEKEFYINDYITLSGGGSSVAVIDRYKSYLDEMAMGETPFDGIGFQCHIGSIPTSIIKIKETLDDFSARYNVPFKITEYDIEPSVDEQTQANYLNDFLTMVFSHPAVESFIMWGFWDDNHWKNNAPMFRSDWSLKPSGEVFINKVFDEWWTNETGTTDENGLFQPRAFKGDYIITVSQGEQIFEVLVNAIDDMQVDIETDFTSSTLDPVLQEIEVYPNPSNGRFQIKLPNHLIQVSLDIFDVTGKLIISKPSISQTDEIILDKNGLYQMRFVSGNNIGFKSVFVNF